MAATGFLQYQEPDIVSLLILISFLFFLSSLGWVFNSIIRAGLIGQILVGILYGTPVGNILDTKWQETFMVLGYIGLILIIFEGGLTIRLDLFKANFCLSILAAAIGVITPIGLCYLILYLGFGYGALETFIVGASLSTTSIGTTFVVISNSENVDLTHTKVGTVLISAALFDDVVGLIMVSVISRLGEIEGGGTVNIGWMVGRPIVASFAIGAVSPLLARYVAGPLYRRLLEQRVASLGHKPFICIMTLTLSAHIVICSYAGASLLSGAFLAGAFLNALPTELTDLVQPGNDMIPERPSFHGTFEKYISGAQAFILEPLFFASIGFAIPFKRMWTGTIVWRGIVLSLLMAIGKAVVGLAVPLWDLIFLRPPSEKSPVLQGRASSSKWAAATMLGMAMIARGEIGLLIIQLGLNSTSALSEEAFLVAIWAIVLNTILGPVSVAVLLTRSEQVIARDPRWGIQKEDSEDGSASGLTSPSPLRIYVYPIKSLRGITLQQARLDRQGVQYDRRFMLLRVHDDGHLEPVEIVRFPACALFIPEIVEDKIVVRYKIPEEPLFPPTPEQKTTLEIPLDPDTSGLEQVEVELYKSKCMGYRMPDHYNSWFSSCFGFETILVHVGDGRRPVLGTMSPYAQEHQNKSFLSSLKNYITGSNEGDPHWLTFTCIAAYLITTEASLKDVSSRLPPGEDMEMRKFRPNLVVDGEGPYDEDFWGEIEIGHGPRFALTGNCGRCLSINVDYETGRMGTGESGTVIKKLMKDRRVDLGYKWSPVVGRYGFLVDEKADVHVGDEVAVTERLEKRRVWDWPDF